MDIECREVSTLNTLSQTFSGKDVLIWNIVISCEKYKPDCSQIHIRVQNIECREVSTQNTLSQAFSRKDGPIRNTVISFEKYKRDCSQFHIKVQNIECREVSTLNTLSLLQRSSNQKYGYIIWEIQTWLLTNPYKSWILNAEMFPL